MSPATSLQAEKPCFVIYRNEVRAADLRDGEAGSLAFREVFVADESGGGDTIFVPSNLLFKNREEASGALYDYLTRQRSYVGKFVSARHSHAKEAEEKLGAVEQSINRHTADLVDVIRQARESGTDISVEDLARCLEKFTSATVEAVDPSRGIHCRSIEDAPAFIKAALEQGLDEKSIEAQVAHLTNASRRMIIGQIRERTMTDYARPLDSSGMTRWHQLAAEGRFWSTVILARAKEFLTVKDATDRTPLHYAAMTGGFNDLLDGWVTHEQARALALSPDRDGIMPIAIAIAHDPTILNSSENAEIVEEYRDLTEGEARIAS